MDKTEKWIAGIVAALIALALALIVVGCTPAKTGQTPQVAQCELVEVDSIQWSLGYMSGYDSTGYKYESQLDAMWGEWASGAGFRMPSGRIVFKAYLHTADDRFVILKMTAPNGMYGFGVLEERSKCRFVSADGMILFMPTRYWRQQ